MKPLHVLSLAVAVSTSLPACGKKSADAPPPPPIDVAGVNALVPAELSGKLVFEQRDLVEERGKRSVTYTLAAPKGWNQSMKGMANLRPDQDLGFMTSFSVGTNCDGECKAKDWAKVADKVNFAQFSDGKIVRDESTKTGRLLIAEKGDSTYVVRAWWRDGGSRYSTCTASLEAPVRAAAPAFAKACEAVAIKGAD